MNVVLTPGIFECVLENLSMRELEKYRYVSKYWNDRIVPILDKRYKTLLALSSVEVKHQHGKSPYVFARKDTLSFSGRKHTSKDYITIFPSQDESRSFILAGSFKTILLSFYFQNEKITTSNLNIEETKLEFNDDITLYYTVRQRGRFEIMPSYIQISQRFVRNYVATIYSSM